MPATVHPDAADRWLSAMYELDRLHPLTGGSDAPAPGTTAHLLVREAIAADQQKLDAATKWLDAMYELDRLHPLTFGGDPVVGTHAHLTTREGMAQVIDLDRLRLLREFNPNHDQKGQFTFGSGGGSVPIVKPGPSTGYSPDQIREVSEVVNDALKNEPTLTHPIAGGRRLAAVGFVSSPTPPAGINAEDWSGARNETISSDAEAVTSSTQPGVTFIVVNDSRMPGYDMAAGQVALSRGFLFPTGGSTYGTVMHEIGHAWASSYGVQSQNDAGAALTDAGVGPQDIRAAGSVYGSSGPQEGIAEMYAMANTPGFGEPPSLATGYDKLVQSVQSGSWHQVAAAADEAGTFQPAHPLVLVGDRVARIKAAAARNLAANAWVTSPSGTLKEYNQNHDERGRFASGEGSAEVPKGLTAWQPGQLGKGLYIPSQNRMLAWQVTNAAGFPHHGDVMAQQSGTPFTAGAGAEGLQKIDSPTIGPNDLAYSTRIMPDGGVRFQDPLDAENRYQAFAHTPDEANSVIDKFVGTVPGTYNAETNWRQADFTSATNPAWHGQKFIERMIGAMAQAGLEALREFNPNHDARGEFASGGGGGFQGTASEAIRFASTAVSQPDLTHAQRMALTQYTTEATGSFNTDLRTGRIDSSNGSVQALDSAVAAGTTNQDLVAYRGMSEANLGRLQPGAMLTDKGYVSTTLLAPEAQQFGPALVEVHIPSGSHLLSVASTGLGAEAELLLGRDSQFRVDSVAPQHVTVTYMGAK